MYIWGDKLNFQKIFSYNLFNCLNLHFLRKLIVNINHIFYKIRMKFQYLCSVICVIRSDPLGFQTNGGLVPIFESQILILRFNSLG